LTLKEAEALANLMEIFDAEVVDWEDHGSGRKVRQSEALPSRGVTESDGSQENPPTDVGPESSLDPTLFTPERA
jgi:hypothetical protein